MGKSSYGRSTGGVVPLSSAASDASAGSSSRNVDSIALAAAESVALLVPGRSSGNEIQINDDAPPPRPLARPSMPAAGYSRKLKKGGEEECLSPLVLVLSLVCFLLILLFMSCYFFGHIEDDRIPLTPADLEPPPEVVNEAGLGIPYPHAFQQYSFHAQGLHMFVQYSAYRTSASSFVALGLGARALVADAHATIRNCSWVPREVQGTASEIPGSVNVVENAEHHYLTYGVLLLVCTLDSDTSPVGGYLSIEIGGVNSIAYTEQPNSAAAETPMLDGPYLHNVSHCSAPMYSQLSTERVVQWTRMHFHIGIDYFLFFDAGAADAALRAALKPYVWSGVVEFVDFRGVHEYDVFYHGQLLAVNDCVYRLRSTSKWLISMDFDEYLWIGRDDLTRLPDFLKSFDGKAAVTHGSLWWSLNLCLAPEGDQDPRWPIERMLWHWPKWYCLRENEYPNLAMCLNYYGHRKLIVDPRQVRMLENHWCVDCQGGVLDLPAEDLHHNHFQGLVTLQFEGECNTTKAADDPIEWWAHGTEQSAVAQAVRGTPLHWNQIKEEREWWAEFVKKSRGKD